jgi:hypothetical protein
MIISIIDNKMVEVPHEDLRLLWPNNYKQGEASDRLAAVEIAIDGAKIGGASIIFPAGNLHITTWNRKSSVEVSFSFNKKSASRRSVG